MGFPEPHKYKSEGDRLLGRAFENCVCLGNHQESCWDMNCWTAVHMIDRCLFAFKCCLYARKQTCNHTAIEPCPLLLAIEMQTTMLGILELVKQYVWNAVQSQKIIRYHHGCAVLSLSGPISCVKWHFLLFTGHLTKMRWAVFFHYITWALCQCKTVASEG